MIITESAAVHPSSNAYNIQLTNPHAVEALGTTADRVKKHGCKIFGQLGHGGRETHSGTDGSAPAAYAPSAIASERFRVMPRAMSQDMIAEIVAAFGEAAKRYEEAGYDGMEIMVSHGLLLAQFLNPNSNVREDEYGGSRKNRLRILREVIASIRAKIGNRMVVGIRISGDELSTKGLEATEVFNICKELDGDKTLDFLDICGGSMTGVDGSIHVVPPMNYEPGYLSPISKRIKDEIKTAVFMAGRINDPREAERLIAERYVDMCGMTRAQICDPEMASKIMSDAVDDIRACIGCNQACIGHMQAGYPISCIQHPETGREGGLGKRIAAKQSLKVLIAGGGPAGMKAAAVAAERGHIVTICEKEAVLGGQAKLASKLPGRDEFGGIVTNLAHEMKLHSVNVRLNTPVTRELIEREKPDTVVITTGSQPHMPHGLLFDEAHVLHATQALQGANVGTNVVIADTRCDWVGLGLAEQLARNGCSVRLAVNGYMPGQSIQQYTRDRWVGDLHKLGVEITPFARLIGADKTTSYFQHTASGEPIMLEDMDTLVMASGAQNDISLEQELRDWDGEIWVAGDAVTPRTCEEAVLEGLKVGSAIGGGTLSAADSPLRLKTM